MRKYILILFLLTFISMPIVAAHAAVPIPFGGLVTMMQPCDEGLLVYVLTPITGVIPFMWLWGELPFLMYIPPHIGQELLGYAATVPAVCTISGVPYGAGLPIIMHGSSF